MRGSSMLDQSPEYSHHVLGVSQTVTLARVAPRSMVVPGTLEDWRDWTGLPFDETGPVLVPQALTPVHCDVEHGFAAYVEPNVWVVHPTGG